jgi:hypothetical protein
MNTDIANLLHKEKDELHPDGVCSLTPSRRVVTMQVTVDSSKTCRILVARIRAWLLSEDVDITELLYSPLSDGEYLEVLKDSSLVRVPLLLQSVDYELFRFTLDANLDCTVRQRIENASPFLLERWTKLLAIPTALTIAERNCALKHIASAGHTAVLTYNIWVAAGCPVNEFVGNIYLKGSTDWQEFFHAVCSTCRAAGAVPKWTQHIEDMNAVQSIDQPAIYLLAPHAGRQIADIIYAACFEPSLGLDPFVRPSQDTGILRVSWSGSHRYVPMDAWLPKQLRHWTILVVVPSRQDAPFRVNAEFGKAFGAPLHNDCLAYLARCSIVEWRLAINNR